MQQKIDKKFFVFKIIAFELVAEKFTITKKYLS